MSKMLTYHFKQIEKARFAHTNWLRRAKHLIEGLPVSEEMLPLAPDACEFGRWYSGVDKKLKKFPQLREVLENIEQYHFEVHAIYFNIYDIYYIQLERSWFMAKIFDSRKEPTEEQKKAAYMYFDALEQASEKLLSELDSLEMSLKLLKPEEQQLILSFLQ